MDVKRRLLREDELTHFDRYPHRCLDIEGDWVPCPDHLCEAWRSVHHAHTMQAALERIATQGSPDDAAFARRVLRDLGRLGMAAQAGKETGSSPNPSSLLTDPSQQLAEALRGVMQAHSCQIEFGDYTCGECGDARDLLISIGEWR